MVEVPERRGERQQREQVEVSEREHPPEIEEPEQERRAEREPDRRAVDLLPTERSLVAARHLPGDLRPRPGFRHATRLVVDLSLGYLAGIDVPVLVAPPDVHRPAPTPGSSAALRGIGLVRSVGDATRGGIAVKPIGDLVVREEAGDRLVLRESRLHVRPVRTGHKCPRRPEDDDSGEQAPQCLLRKDQSLLPMKFAGVTSTIAIACDTIFPTPSSTSAVRIPRFPPYTRRETTKKRRP